MHKTLVVGCFSALALSLIRGLTSHGLLVDGLYHSSITHPEAGTLNRQESVQELESLPSDYTHVFLLGSYIPDRMDDPDEARLQRANVDLVKRVCDHFPDARILFASSVAVYGDQERPLPITEDSQVDPGDGYALSKLAGEEIIRKHPSYSIVRFSSLYGEAMRRPNFLLRCVEQARTQGCIALYGEGLRTQDYLHYDDAAELLMLLAEGQDNLLSLGVSGREWSNREVAEMVAQRVPGVRIEVLHKPEGASRAYRSQIAKNLPFEPGIGLEQGIDRLLEQHS